MNQAQLGRKRFKKSIKRRTVLKGRIRCHGGTTECTKLMLKKQHHGWDKAKKKKSKMDEVNKALFGINKDDKKGGQGSVSPTEKKGRKISKES